MTLAAALGPSLFTATGFNSGSLSLLGRDRLTAPEQQLLQIRGRDARDRRQGSAEQVLEHPRHPYTRLLLEAVPRLGAPLAHSQSAAPTELPGNRKLPGGCFFLERCSRRGPGCENPQALQGAASQQVRCHLQGAPG